MADWRKIPEAGTVFGIRFIVLVTRAFGRRIAGWCLYFPAVYYAAFRGTARRASRDYLRRVGEPATFGNIVRHIHTFAQVSLDRLFFLTGRWDGFHFEHSGHDALVEAAQSGRGVLLLGAHLGSFEVMRCRAKDYNIPINIVVDFSSTERVNGVLRSLAPDIDTRLISLTDPLAAMLAIRAAIDRGEVVAMLGDRMPKLDNGTARLVMAEFLGEEAPFPAGPWLLAHSLRCPVYFVAGVYTRPNRYALHLERLADQVKLDRKERAAAIERYARTYASKLETFTRSAPLNWFNFFDFWSKP
jgi:predicted LPLAT superfamily acyltransferase